MKMISNEIQLLVIDDEETDRRRIKRSFSKRGIQVKILEAESAEKGLEILSENALNEKNHILTLLDINMPEMNGHQFLSELRADPKLSNSIVFVLTSSQLESDREKAYKKNVAGFIHKENLAKDFLNKISLLEKYIITVQFPTP